MRFFATARTELIVAAALFAFGDLSCAALTEFKFPGCDFQVWLRKDAEIENSVLSAFGFDGSEKSRQSALIRLINALEIKIRNFQVELSSKVREVDELKAQVAAAKASRDFQTAHFIDAATDANQQVVALQIEILEIYFQYYLLLVLQNWVTYIS
jgi:hypothetical protein